MEFKSIKVVKEDASRILTELKKKKNKCQVKEMGDENLNSKRLKLGKICGVYIIFVDEKIEYVGKASDLQSRLRSHFISKPNGSHRSKYEKVESALMDRQKIEISFIPVPKAIYSSIEEALIEKLKPTWNQRVG